jgi:3-hydroxyacyl-CoA dehydrogenase
MHPPGLPVNRVPDPYLANAFRMLDDGVSLETIERGAKESTSPAYQ